MNSQEITSGALAIFVKTPGLSPIKTRLASSIGTNNALEFYRLAIKAILSLLKNLKNENLNLKSYFAVAEQEGLQSPIWSDLPTIWQGEGTLGDRLSQVYDQLRMQHSYVCFMGADSPHLPFEHFIKAIQTTENLSADKFVIGETDDGGFYFFGGNLPIPKASWQDVTYSTVHTFRELQTQLNRIAPSTLLTNNFDIDTISDLKRYSVDNFPIHNLLKEQLQLIHWAREIVCTYCQNH